VCLSDSIRVELPAFPIDARKLGKGFVGRRVVLKIAMFFWSENVKPPLRRAVGEGIGTNPKRKRCTAARSR